MAYFKFSLIAFLFACNTAFAGYAQLKPPAGWSQGLGAAVPGTAGTFNYGAAANGAVFKGSTVLTNSSLSVAGQLVTMPASMRLAANAAAVAATYSFGNPWLFLGLAAGTAAYNWYADSGLSLTSDNKWRKLKSGDEYRAYDTDPWVGSKDSAVQQWVANYNTKYSQYPIGSCGMVNASDFTCYYNGSYTGTGSIQHRVAPPTVELVDEAEFVNTLKSKPLPDSLPPLMPAVNWPIELPIFNPDPAVNPLPAPSPNAVPRPLFIPTGNPVATPDPAVWNQPGVRVSPAPSPDLPWRVDITPENIPQGSPTPKTPAELNPPVPLAGQPASDKLGLCDQYPGIAACQPGSKPSDAVDFCKANPDVLACQKIDLDTPDVPDLEKKDVPISITPASGWGAANASCPAPRHLAGANVEMPFTMVCDFMTGLRPILIAIAWLSAAFILLGMKGGSD